MLTIRLQRVGKKKLPTYRLIVSEKGRDTHDRYLELLGTFDPHAAAEQFKPVTDRIKHWISKGSQMSPTVHNLLVAAKIVSGKKEKAVFLTKKRHAKITEKNAAAAKAAADKKAAEEAAKAEAKAKAEADKKAAEEAKAAEAAAPAAEAAPAPEAAPQA
jgi:small subunit ribosomal protein S16